MLIETGSSDRVVGVAQVCVLQLNNRHLVCWIAPVPVVTQPLLVQGHMGGLFLFRSLAPGWKVLRWITWIASAGYIGASGGVTSQHWSLPAAACLLRQIVTRAQPLVDHLHVPGFMDRL